MTRDEKLGRIEGALCAADRELVYLDETDADAIDAREKVAAAIVLVQELMHD